MLVALLAACGGGSGSPEPGPAAAVDGRARAQQAEPGLAGELQASIYGEAGKLIRGDESVTALGNEMFGDRVGLYTGSLEFVQTDVSIPGNSELPVAVARKLTVDPGGGDPLGHFGDWDLEIPRMHGVFSHTRGWVAGSVSGAAAENRCSNYSAPPGVNGLGNSGTFSALEYWHGSFLYVPGSGSQEVLTRTAGSAVPTDANAYPLTTKDRWMIRCIPLAAGGLGEGFLAIAPDGTRYRFDRMVSRQRLPLSKPSPVSEGRAGSGGQGADRVPVGFVLARKEVWILPSTVTDRHGNTVTYNYDAADPWKLTSIVGTDASGSPRVLSFTYHPGTHLVATVTSGTRVWTYSYVTADTRTTLSSLVWPDTTSTWTFNMRPLTFGAPLVTGAASCDIPAYLNGSTPTGTMTHPSGAVGTFVVAATPHGRSHTDRVCMLEFSDAEYAWYPKDMPSFSITSKTINNLGMSTSTWAYAYGPANASYAPCSGCADTKTVTVTDPNGHSTRYTFGNRFRVTEGQLVKTEEGWNGSTALRTIQREYRAPAGGAWPNPIGASPQARGNGDFASRHAPEWKKTVTQQGVNFVWQANDFNQFARPTDVTRASSLGWSRRDITAYNHHLGKWLLNRPETVTDQATGTVVEQNVYDAVTGNRTGRYAFGRLLETTAYHADGNVHQRTDALNRTTTLTSYKRGLARQAAYADATSESAVVNDDGTVGSVTNAAGTTSSYGYDAMGRLSSIVYPGGDPVAYQPTTFTFQKVATVEYGVGAGHWRLTKSTGNARTTTFYDAFWRPVMTRTWDSANEAGTRRVSVTRYDAGGRKVFASYPQRDISSVNDALAGTTTSYDALNRPSQQVASSELGNLTSSTEYLAGFQRRTTNPRQFQTTHSFQAFDEPSEATITDIAAPEGVSVHIERDTFGKARWITRAGGGKTLTRSYVYDSVHRLCKTIEPESGATVVAYHGDSDLKAWTASGLNLPSTGSCSQGSAPTNRRISFGYDLRNRLTSTTYGDGSQNVSRSYTPDGLLQQTVASTAAGSPITWNYSYNNRRLLTREQFAWTSGTVGANDGWIFSHTIDAYGHPAALADPWGTIAYTPNALGEPTQVSGYAGGISYHPTGAVAAYTLGGITHSTTLNVRGLPLRVQNTGVTKDLYAYDANGNVAAITDEQQGINSRTMPAAGGYDGLDRLRLVNAALWGSASYTYDALDNLTASVISGGTAAPARSLTHSFDANNRLASLSGTQNVAFGYDANGNITSRGSQGFSFDIGNRMAVAVGKASYSYDGHGRRAQVAFVGGDTAMHAYTSDGKLRMSQRASEGVTRFVYLGDRLIAEHTPTAVTFQHTDALGSPIARTNSGGGIVSRTRYEPYGAAVAGSANPTTIGFTGHVNDVDTGLVYMQQRYMLPISGRFLSVDPVTTDPKTGGYFNRYVYAESNPYRYRDPDGRCVCFDVPHEAGMAAGLGIGDVVRGPAAAQIAAASQHISAPTMAVGAGLLSGAVGGGTITRYMGPGEAKVAASSGAIPNVGRDGLPRPTHVTTDQPVTSATEAKRKYELPTPPTHSATVPATRVSDLGPTPDGRVTTSGGGSQNATSQPIPVKPSEIKELGK